MPNATYTINGHNDDPENWKVGYAVTFVGDDVPGGIAFDNVYVDPFGYATQEELNAAIAAEIDAAWNRLSGQVQASDLGKRDSRRGLLARLAGANKAAVKSIVSDDGRLVRGKRKKRK